MFIIKEGGIVTTVQDLGRFGYYHIGMPPSGALDNYSFRVGNILVGNGQDMAGLETTFLGPKIEVSVDTVIAITGAPCDPKLNGQEIPMWEAVPVKAGDIISFGFAKSGARSYLTVAGGIDVEVKLGSRSTYLLCGFGGYKGRKLVAGDELKLGNAQTPSQKLAGRKVSPDLIPQFSRSVELRVVVGLCNYRLTQESQQAFLDTQWTVTTEADRVGYRHRGIKLDFNEWEQPFGAGDNPSNVVDLGYPVGSIQVPNGEEPIILLNDAVTGGGYATIGTVISVDLDVVAQTVPNSAVRFKAVGIEEALTIRKQKEAKIARLLADLA